MHFLTTQCNKRVKQTTYPSSTFCRRPLARSLSVVSASLRGNRLLLRNGYQCNGGTLSVGGKSFSAICTFCFGRFSPLPSRLPGPDPNPDDRVLRHAGLAASASTVLQYASPLADLLKVDACICLVEGRLQRYSVVLFHISHVMSAQFFCLILAKHFYPIEYCHAPTSWEISPRPRGSRGRVPVATRSNDMLA